MSYTMDPLACWLLEQLAVRDPQKTLDIIERIEDSFDKDNAVIHLSKHISILTFESEETIEGMVAFPSVNIDASRFHFWHIAETMIEAHQQKLAKNEPLKAQDIVSFPYLGEATIKQIEREPGGAAVYSLEGLSFTRTKQWNSVRSNIISLIQ